VEGKMQTALIVLAVGSGLTAVVVALCCFWLSGKISERERKASHDV
jgi:hypothetical protein